MKVLCNQQTLHKLAKQGHVMIIGNLYHLGNVQLKLDSTLPDNKLQLVGYEPIIDVNSDKFVQFKTLIRLINKLGGNDEQLDNHR